jgi:hypothetical protein
MPAARTVAVAALVCALAAAGNAAGTTERSTPLPDLSLFALAPADFAPAATIASEATRGSVFLRFFRTVRIGSQPLDAAGSVVLVTPNSTEAAAEISTLETFARTKQGRTAIGLMLTSMFTDGIPFGGTRLKLKTSKIVVGPPATLGQNGLRLTMTVTTAKGTDHMTLAILAFDRILTEVVLIPPQGAHVATDTITHVVAAMEAHADEALTVVSTGPPTVSGTRPLRVDEGSWRGAPASFAYAWSRCDPTGASCVVIAGATGATYAPTPDDAGSSIRVTVTASNTVSSATATSAQSAPVS